MNDAGALSLCFFACASMSIAEVDWMWCPQIQTEMMGDIHHYAWRARHRNQTVYINKRDSERFGDWTAEQCAVSQLTFLSALYCLLHAMACFAGHVISACTCISSAMTVDASTNTFAECACYALLFAVTALYLDHYTCQATSSLAMVCCSHGDILH